MNVIIAHHHIEIVKHVVLQQFVVNVLQVKYYLFFKILKFLKYKQDIIYMRIVCNNVISLVLLALLCQGLVHEHVLLVCQDV